MESCGWTFHRCFGSENTTTGGKRNDGNPWPAKELPSLEYLFKPAMNQQSISVEGDTPGNRTFQAFQEYEGNLRIRTMELFTSLEHG